MLITIFFPLTLPSAHSKIAHTVFNNLYKIKLLDSVVAEVRDTVKEEEIWGGGALHVTLLQLNQAVFSCPKP